MAESRRRKTLRSIRMARSETAAKPGDKVACCARVFDPIITHIDASYCHSQRPVAALSREGEESLFSVSGAKTAKTTEILRKLRMTIDLCVTIKVFDCAPALDRRSSERPSASHPQPSAFTLIELLVVVAIIATLAAILLPALKGGRDRAYTAVCANQLRQINFGLVMYQDDFDRCYPPLLYDGTTTRTDPAMSFMKSLPAAGGNGYVCWLWLLYPYHHKPEIYICPSAKYKGNGWTYDMALGFGSWVSTTGAWSAYCFSGTGTPVGPVRQGNEAYTDRKILIFDGREGILGKSPVGTSGGTRYVMGYGGYQDFQHNGAPRGGPNCLFVDGHVGWMSGFYFWAFNDAGQRWFQPCAVSLP